MYLLCVFVPNANVIYAVYMKKIITLLNIQLSGI